MQDCRKGQLSLMFCVVPCLANSSAHWFDPHSPEWAAIQCSSNVLVVAMFFIPVRQSATILLRMVLDLMASKDERQSAQIIECLQE